MYPPLVEPFFLLSNLLVNLATWRLSSQKIPIGMISTVFLSILDEWVWSLGEGENRIIDLHCISHNHSLIVLSFGDMSTFLINIFVFN